MPKTYSPTFLCSNSQTPPFAPCNGRVFVLNVHTHTHTELSSTLAHQHTASQEECFFMAALSKDTGKCSAIAEGGTSHKKPGEKHLNCKPAYREAVEGPSQVQRRRDERNSKPYEDTSKSNKQRCLQTILVSTVRPKETYHLPKLLY